MDEYVSGRSSHPLFPSCAGQFLSKEETICASRGVISETGTPLTKVNESGSTVDRFGEHLSRVSGAHFFPEETLKSISFNCLDDGALTQSSNIFKRPLSHSPAAWPHRCPPSIPWSRFVMRIVLQVLGFALIGEKDLSKLWAISIRFQRCHQETRN